MASTDPARAAEGLALLAESIALNQRLGDPTQANESLDLQGNLFLAANRFLEARGTFQEVLATADRLGMSRHGVDWYLRQIHSKLRVKTTTHAVYKALKQGVIG